MAGKKDKKKIAKKRQKTKQQKAKKRKLRVVKGGGGEGGSGAGFEHVPEMPQMEAPEGFRALSFSQALMEYAKPLMEDRKNKKALEAVFQLSGLFWNYALDVQKGAVDQKMEKDILAATESALKLDKQEAQSLIRTMVERFDYLFPENIQPKRPSPIMFIRKEVRYLIRPYDYEKLIVSDRIVPPDTEDHKAIDRLLQLDDLMAEGADYEDYEPLLTDVKTLLETRFGGWLMAKGIKEEAHDFASCPFIFFDFVYGYMHDDVMVIKTVSEESFAEFFEDFLIRKVMAEPTEYILWLPALKLFYQFLFEKGYLNRPEKFIRSIDKIESSFIEVLKHKFS